MRYLGGLKMARENITFKCADCGEENYIGTRNKKKHPQRMEILKYCRICRKKTTHKEKK
jgi:large subunit ribosomal protein L33